ncbi:uncharacterized protein LOC143650095 [Tamandua tetradactyla]|uniref:uncharacterized protein LOC143650095 n=1 Tax=Tamandua tetradactyla TaxID=48850 RepID=UPI0040539A71
MNPALSRFSGHFSNPIPPFAFPMNGPRSPPRVCCSCWERRAWVSLHPRKASRECPVILLQASFGAAIPTLKTESFGTTRTNRVHIARDLWRCIKKIPPGRPLKNTGEKASRYHHVFPADR